MKKRRILALIAALLCLSMCFVACKKNDEQPPEETTGAPAPTEDPTPIMEQLFNPAWKPTASLTPTAATKIEVTGDYEDYTDDLVLTTKTNSDGNKVQTVLSLVTGEVLNTFTDTETQYTDPDTNNVYDRQLTHHVYFPEDTPFYVVLTVFDKDINTSKSSVHSHLFDAEVPFDDYDTDDIELSMKLYNVTAADAVASIDDSDIIEEVAEDAYHGYDFDYNLRNYDLLAESSESETVTFDNKTYDIDLEENTITAHAEGLNVLLEKYYDFETKDHYIYYSDGNVTFMDKSFKTLYAYSIPYESNSISVNPLNNGSVLVQYSTRLPDDATSYDYIEEGAFTAIEKYDLTSVILKADKTETEVELKYIINNINTAYALSEEYEGDYLAEGVENVAIVSYINENGYVEYTSLKDDVVIMDNDAAIVKSVKVLHNQYDIPQNLGNGIYQVTVITNAYDEYHHDYIYEYVITNAKGEELYTSAVPFGNTNYRYTQIGDVIYDKNTSKAVYDLKANKAYLIAMYSNSFIVSINSEKEGTTSYYKVTADETKLIGVVGGANATVADVNAYTYFYAVKALDTGYYTYYNENDVAITGMPELSHSVYDITYNENCVAVYEQHWDETAEATVYNYYIIK